MITRILMFMFACSASLMANNQNLLDFTTHHHHHHDHSNSHGEQIGSIYVGSPVSFAFLNSSQVPQVGTPVPFTGFNATNSSINQGVIVNTNDSTITVTRSGVYSISFSLSYSDPLGGTTSTFWVAVNGTIQQAISAATTSNFATGEYSLSGSGFLILDRYDVVSLYAEQIPTGSPTTLTVTNGSLNVNLLEAL